MIDLVSETIAEFLVVDLGDVSPDTHLKDKLGADSLDLIEIFNALEVETGETLSKDKVRTVETVQDIVELLGGTSGND